MEQSAPRLTWEVAVFALFVCGTTALPLWAARRAARSAGVAGGEGDGRKRRYVFAAGGVSTLTMLLSVSRGTLGVRSFLGFPSELVYFGAAMWETLYGMALAFPLVGLLFVPVFVPLRCVSVYRYLELRFGGAAVRRLAAATFVWRQVLNLAVTAYTPAVALHAVLGVPHWASALTLAALAALSAALGGLGAAVRADVLQTMAMVLVSLLLLARGAWLAGGPGAVFAAALEGGRFATETWNPRARVDTASALVGQLFMSLSIYGCQQTFVARYASMPSRGAVMRMLLLCVPAVALLFSLSWVVGMALYAVYRHCDPLAAGRISAMDEIVPYFVVHEFDWLPGLLGLFLGGLFNGALSFLVSNVSSLATVLWEDFLSALPVCRDASDRRQLTVIKVTAGALCLLIALLSLGVGAVGGVVEASLLVTSATAGPLLGVFLLAALYPPATARGAVVGMLFAHAATTTMGVGRMLANAGADRGMLPLLTDGCTAEGRNATSLPAGLADPESAAAEVSLWFGVSYMWYAALGTASCMLVGAAASAVAGGARHVYAAELLHPAALRLSRALPGRRREFAAPEEEQKTPQGA